MRWLSVSLFLAVCLPQPLSAADDVQELTPIVVSATRTPRSLIPTGANISVVSRAEIASSGAATLASLLRGRGGIQISDLFGDGSRPTVSMRGFGANAAANTLILVDGRRLNNADLGAPDLNSIPLQDIERIELVQGSGGVLFGDQAVGGVVNIITRDPERFRVSLTAQAGSFGHEGLGAAVENRHATGIGYRVSGMHRQRDNYRDNNELEYSSAFGQVDYNGERGRAFFEYQAIDETLEAPGGLFLDQIAVNRRQALNPNDFTDTQTRLGRVGGSIDLPARWEAQFEYTNRISDSDGLLSVLGTPSAVSTKRHHQEFTPRLVRTWESGAREALLTVGADVFHTRFFLTSILGDIDDEQSNISGYGRLILPLNDRLTVTVGHRQAIVENDIQGALLPPGSEIDDEAQASELGLSVLLAPAWQVFGRVETHYRFVLADEYTSASFGGVIPVTQTGRSVELGTQWQHERGLIKLGLYQLDVEDEIEFDPIRFINTNIGDTRRRGLNIEAQWLPWSPLKLSAEYGFVEPEIVAGALEGREIPFVAHHVGRVGASYRVAEGLFAGMELYGISGRVAVGDFDNTLPGAPGYVVARATVSYAWKGLSVELSVNNLLGAEYADNAQTGFRPPLFIPETVRFPAPREDILVTLRYVYD
ncbi:MAG: TonB-dependent receptor [Chromatiales bacterium]